MSFISKEPVKLVAYNDKSWEVTDEAIQLLPKLKKPIKVLAIAGRYRSGKSHILNKFLGVEQGGFDLGHTFKGCTQGIWMWGKDTGKEIVLALDTEGLNDVDNDSTFDSKIFSLALLLSSYLVINILGVLDENTIQLLSFVTNLSKIIFTEKTNEEEDDGTEYKEIFPPVMFLIRDLVLSPEEGQTLDDYLAGVLKQRPGRSQEIKAKNDIRDAITQSLPAREMMAIPPPHVDKKILQNIQKHEAELSKDFKIAVDEVCTTLHKKLKTKHAKYDGDQVEITDGDSYLEFVKAVVQGLNTNGKIEIPSLFQAVYEMERKKHVKLGTEMLFSQFEEISKKFPLNETDLIRMLESAQTSIVDEISKKIVDAEMLSEVTEDLKKLSEQMQANICSNNADASRALCKELKAGLVEELKKESFKTVEEFEGKKLEKIKLLDSKGVGPALKEVLIEFDSDCVHIREILYTQLKLEEKAIEAAEEARKNKEHLRQLEQMRKDSEEAEKQRKIREDALKAQADALEKKFEEASRKLNEEHEEMKKKFEQELLQAKRVQDTRLIEIAEQQYETYNRKRKQKPREKPKSGQIYVRGYTKANGTKVKGYWREK